VWGFLQFRSLLPSLSRLLPQLPRRRGPCASSQISRHKAVFSFPKVSKVSTPSSPFERPWQNPNGTCPQSLSSKVCSIDSPPLSVVSRFPFCRVLWQAEAPVSFRRTALDGTLCLFSSLFHSARRAFRATRSPLTPRFLSSPFLLRVSRPRFFPPYFPLTTWELQPTWMHHGVF